MHQACAHCAIFSPLPPRRSLDRVSVPVWLVILRPARGRVALVSRYLTNKLIPSGQYFSDGKRPEGPSLVLRRYAVLATVSSSYPLSIRQFPDITTRPPLSAKQQAASCYRSDSCMLACRQRSIGAMIGTLQFKSLMLMN